MSIEYEPEVIDQKKSPLKTQNEEKITFEVDLSTEKSLKIFLIMRLSEEVIKK